MKALRISVLAALLATSGAAFAQTSPGSAPARDGGTVATDRDGGHDWGWIGLFGLVGLAGLMPKRDRRPAATVGTGTERAGSYRP